MNRKKVLAALMLFLAPMPGLRAQQQRQGRIALIKDADVYVMLPEGSDLRRLTLLGPDSSAELPSWEPSGEHIVYTVTFLDSPPQIWIMDANGRNQHRLLDDPDYGDTAGSFSPDGWFVIFSRCDLRQACGIYQVRVDGAALTPITNIQTGRVDSFPVFSTDGESIAFERHDSNDSSTVMVMNRDGSHPHPLTRDGVRAHHPAWSLDGERIVFSCDCDASGNFRIWSANRMGEGLTPVVPLPSKYSRSTAPDHLFPSWSPDENYLAVEQHSVGSDPCIVIMNIRHDASGRPFKNLISGRQPSWSLSP